MVWTSPSAEGMWVSSLGEKIPDALGLKNQTIKQKQCRNKLNEDFKTQEEETVLAICLMLLCGLFKAILGFPIKLRNQM